MLQLIESATSLKVVGDPAILDRLYLKFRYRPNRFFMADSYQIFRKTGGTRGWDGWRCPFKKSVKTPNALVCGRGWKNQVIAWLEVEELQYDGSQLLTNPFAGLEMDDIPDDLLGVPLDQQQWSLQKRCLLALLRAGVGRVKVTVSGGKTALFCACASMIKRHYPDARFLYFTPTERLVKQVYSESQKFLPGWDIGQLGGGGQNETAKDLIVATGAVLNRRHEKFLRTRWYQTFTALLADECQFSASASQSQAILASSAFFRLGASDTKKDEDVDKHVTLTGLLGDFHEEVLYHELLEIDRVAAPRIYFIEKPEWHNKFRHLTHAPELDSKAWVLADEKWHTGIYCGPVHELDAQGEVLLDRAGEPVKVPNLHLIEINGNRHPIESRWCLLSRKYDAAISSFKERNELIARWVKHFSSQDKTTLVVATRTLHVMLLQAHVEKLVHPKLVKVLYSAHSSKERDAAFEWLKATPGAVLISPLVKVGVSIPEINAGIIADYVGDWEYFNQLVGRFIRRKPKGEVNEADVVFLHDVQHPSYARGSRNILERISKIKGYNIYTGISEPTEVNQAILKGSQVDLLDLNQA